LIKKERGSSNINIYLVVLYKKYSVPVSAFILTIIAVSVSVRKEGMGMNLTIVSRLLLAMFFDKIFGTLAEKSTFRHYWPSGFNVILNISDFFTTQCKTIN
jgi:lipopolysaccharide export system permease protein